MYIFPKVCIEGRPPQETFQAAVIAKNYSTAEAMVKAYDTRGVSVGPIASAFYIRLATEHAEPGVIAWNGPA